MITFENYDRKIHKIQAALEKYSIKDLSEAAAICRDCLLYTSDAADEL